jgi:hypothetical protein
MLEPAAPIPDHGHAREDAGEITIEVVDAVR